MNLHRDNTCTQHGISCQLNANTRIMLEMIWLTKTCTCIGCDKLSDTQLHIPYTWLQKTTYNICVHYTYEVIYFIVPTSFSAAFFLLDEIASISLVGLNSV